ncbi:hypothetical protein [Methanobrevibacter sp.]|uniref:hypothetical protein n=1 Tax=Methanobrevibacter sp. TaxID=66852 RepID=UPI003890A9C4
MARRNEGIIALLMILALIAFVVGSAVGISISIGEHDNQTKQNNTTHFENVTSEMLSNKNPNVSIEYDYDLDSVDYNQNYTNITR